jgi:hypothetical protein
MATVFIYVDISKEVGDVDPREGSWMRSPPIPTASHSNMTSGINTAKSRHRVHFGGGSLAVGVSCGLTDRD